MLDLSGGEGESLADRLGEMASRAASVAALEEVMLPKLRETQMEELFTKIELPLCAVLAKMENEGFLADAEALRAFGESLTGSIDALREAVWAEAGEEFNIQSPKQLGAVLFEKLGLPGGKKTKTGWSTNADVLDKLRYEPIVRRRARIPRAHQAQIHLRGRPLEGHRRGRTHPYQFPDDRHGDGTSFVHRAELAEHPRPARAGRRDCAKCSSPRPGNVLVDADYSQIELRLLAHISGDEAMRAAFLSGEDVHRVTASQVFGVPLEDVTAEDAPQREGRELRHRVRHFRLLARAGHRRQLRRGEGVYGRLFRALPRRARLPEGSRHGAPRRSAMPKRSFTGGAICRS